MRKRFLICICVVLLVLSLMLCLVACKHDHIWSAEWQSNETHHWHSCTKKKCKSNQDKAEHIFTQESDNFEHWYECDVCGYIKGKEAHTLDSNLRCTVCGKVHSHIIEYNDTKHWYSCFGCNLSGNEAAHNFINGVCTTCNYLQGTPEVHCELNADGYSYQVTRLDLDIENPVRNVIVPEYYNGLPVTVIGANAFNGNSSMNKITLPKTIVTIEDNAFSRCFGLAEIEIPKSVKNIGSNVFEDCYGITIKAEMTTAPSGWDTSDWEIDQWCRLPIVWDCKNNDKTIDGDIYFLNELENYSMSEKYVIKGDVAYVAKQPRILDEQLQGRDYYTFKTEVEYKGVRYPVVGVEDYALYNYDSITEIELKATFLAIGSNAFEGCTNLKKVFWKEDPTIEYNVSIGFCAFRNAINLVDINLPNKIKSFGAYSFSGCIKLGEIIIPESVEEIKEGAFEDCISLVIKNVVPTKPAKWDNKWNLSNCPVIWDCENGNGETEDGKIVFKLGVAVYLLDPTDHTAILLKQEVVSDDSHWNISPTTKYPQDNIDYEIVAIGANAFVDDDFITSVTIPATVKTIGDYAFSGCSKLKEVTILGKEITIGSNAFANCKELETINFAGTEAEWNAITKGSNWDLLAGNYTVKFEYIS